MLRVPARTLSKFSTLIILNLEIQSLYKLDTPLSVVFCVSGFAFIFALQFSCQSDILKNYSKNSTS